MQDPNADPVPSIPPGTFADAAPLPKGAGSDTATLLPNGKVLILGAGPAQLYDPETNSYSPAGRMGEERSRPIATRLADGRVLVFGGTGFGSCSVGTIESAEIYSPATNRFTKMSASLSDFQAATLLDDGTVLLTGGTPSGYRSPSTADAYHMTVSALFDPKTNKLTKLTGDIQPPYGAAIAMLPDHRVLFAGGVIPGQLGDVSPTVSSAVAYDPATRRFTSLAAQMTFPRGNAAAARLSDGRVLIVGGLVDANGVCTEACQRSAEIYDPLTGRFFAAGSGPMVCRSPVATVLPGDAVLIADSSGGLKTEVWSAGTFHLTTGQAAASQWTPATVALPDGRVLLVGGGIVQLYQP